ncbi:MAG: hypothetical protein EAX96_03885 [Candidatus Lokiarchaeota archaeon]|nr:hypothetical protein [Candidatus Lokiarchaeota archaeon]
MFEERNNKIDKIFQAIFSKKFDEVKEKIKDLNKDYDINNFNSTEITSLTTMFDFPIEKEIKICFHEDSVVLCYDSGYFYQGERIEGERMFFYNDIISMKYLKLLLIYINAKVGNCSSCSPES